MRIGDTITADTQTGIYVSGAPLIGGKWKTPIWLQTFDATFVLAAQRRGEKRDSPFYAVATLDAGEFLVEPETDIWGRRRFDGEWKIQRRDGSLETLRTY